MIVPEWLLLWIYQALIGEIGPEIRAIAVKFNKDNKKLLLRYYFDREPIEEDIDDLECIIANIYAHTNSNDQIKDIKQEYIFSNKRMADLNSLDLFLYVRKEREVLANWSCNMQSLMDDLNENFPLFGEAYDLDDNEYAFFGGFGSYMVDLMNLYSSGEINLRSFITCNLEEQYTERKNLENEIIKFFKYIDSLYLKNDLGVLDILNTCIFEAMMGCDFSYNLARKYLSKEAYNHYLFVARRVV